MIDSGWIIEDLDPYKSQDEQELVFAFVFNCFDL